MQVSHGHRRVARQRHVDPVLGQAAVELGGLELPAALADQGLDRLLDLVGGLAHRATLIGRKLADRAQSLGQLCLAAEIAHAQLLELRARAGGSDRLLGLPADLVEAEGRLSHGEPSYLRPRTAPRSSPWRR